jgi:uncharacterized protein
MSSCRAPAALLAPLRRRLAHAFPRSLAPALAAGARGGAAGGPAARQPCAPSSPAAGVPSRRLSLLASLARPDDSPTHIVAHDKYGFNVNGIHMRGSILAFNNFTLLWNVQHVVAATPRSLAAVHMVRPKVEVLLVGTGETAEHVNPALYAYFSRRGVSIEAMTTTQAISTFNVLASEGRPVCAALVSREPVTRDEACLYTPDAAARVTKQDREILAALAADVLPADRAMLLEGGKSGEGDSAEGPAAAAAAAAAAARSAGPSPPASTPAAAPADPPQTVRLVEAKSAAIATRYGYPGALPPDISPLPEGHQRRKGIATGGGNNNTSLWEKAATGTLEEGTEGKDKEDTGSTRGLGRRSESKREWKP